MNLTNTCAGFIIGKVESDKVSLLDVVPLFHTTVFGPMLEVSTMLVSVCGVSSKAMM